MDGSGRRQGATPQPPSSMQSLEGTSHEEIAAFTDWLIDTANLPAGRHDVATLWDRFRASLEQMDAVSPKEG
jgi:hypothetical protein